MPATVRNPAREKLEAGQLSLGVGIRMTRSVEIAKAMAVSGFDWLFLDMEHGVMSLEACARSRPPRSTPASRRSRGCRTANTRSRRGRSTTARSASSCRMSTPRPRRGGRQPAEIPAGRPPLDGRHRAALRAALGSHRRGGAGAQRRQSDDRHAGDPDRDRQCRGDRRGAGGRRAADRHQRSVRRDGHPRRFRERPGGRGLSRDDRGLQASTASSRAWPASTTSRSCRAISTWARASSCPARTPSLCWPARPSAPASCARPFRDSSGAHSTRGSIAAIARRGRSATSQLEWRRPRVRRTRVRASSQAASWPPLALPVEYERRPSRVSSFSMAAPASAASSSKVSSQACMSRNSRRGVPG